MKTYRTQKLKKLADAFLSLKDSEQMLNFLRDLCTLEELEELSARFEVAEMLAKGMSYRKISSIAKVSTTTITRIALWLEHGGGGYKAVLNKKKKHSV